MTLLESTLTDLADTIFEDRLSIFIHRAMKKGRYYSVVHDETNDKIVFRWPGDARPVRIPLEQFIELSSRSATAPQLRVVK